VKAGISFVEATTDQRSHAREEFSEHERLRQIVVSAGIQSLNALLHESSSGKHHHGRFDSALTQFAADFDSAYTWQPNIQQDGVVIHFPAELEGFLAGIRDIHGVGIFPKGAGNEARNFSFIFGE
jgi:hypothetical protein